LLAEGSRIRSLGTEVRQWGPEVKHQNGVWERKFSETEAHIAFLQEKVGQTGSERLQHKNTLVRRGATPYVKNFSSDLRKITKVSQVTRTSVASTYLNATSLFIKTTGRTCRLINSHVRRRTSEHEVSLTSVKYT